MNNDTILKVNELKTYFYLPNGSTIKAVDGISFGVHKGEIFGVVGESGSGKSVTARSIMRMVESPGKIIAGDIWFNGKNIVGISDKEIEKIRGTEISIIFQDPSMSLNPLFTIGKQFADTIVAHEKNIDKNSIKERIINCLSIVGVPDAKNAYDKYACNFSIGFIQRIAIALAIVLNPILIIADEPTTALGITIQAQILKVLQDIQKKFQTSMIFITHDFGVISQIATKVMVMYAGKCVEYSDKLSLLTKPKHPYTVGLIKSVPLVERDRSTPLFVIPGFPPDLSKLANGCPYYPRCEYGKSKCMKETPTLCEVEPGHLCACHFPLKESDNIINFGD